MKSNNCAEDGAVAGVAISLDIILENFRSIEVFRFITSVSKPPFSMNSVPRILLVQFRRFRNGASRACSVQHFLSYEADDEVNSVAVATNIPFSDFLDFPREYNHLTIRSSNSARAVAQVAGGGAAGISIDSNGNFNELEDRVVDD